MSVFKASVKKINRNVLPVAKERLFNTNRLGELVVDGDDSIFYYTDNKSDRRDSAVEYKVDETAAAITTFYGGAGNEFSVPALKKKVNGRTIDYAKTVILNLDDIVDGYADATSATKSWIVCKPNAFTTVEYQVNAPLSFFDGVSNFLTYSFLDAVNGAAITADAVGVINYATKAIAVTVNNGATVTGLKASFVASSGVSVLVGSTAQVTATTANDFTNPVVYTLVGVDGKSVAYTVTVTIAGA